MSLSVSVTICGIKRFLFAENAFDHSSDNFFLLIISLIFRYAMQILIMRICEKSKVANFISSGDF